MMANRMDDADSDYGKITLDCTEPHAKKILQHFTQKETLEILELMQNPSTICEVYARSSYPKATLYKRMSDLLDCGLLFAVKKENINGEDYGSWIYAKSFHALSVKFCRTVTDADPQSTTVIEILPKRNVHAQILKMIRGYQAE